MGTLSVRELSLSAGVVALVSLVSCSSADEHETATTASAAQGCRPGELTRADGSCQPAGVPPEAYGTGFEADGTNGMTAILPLAACPKGKMAVPGERACREVAPCAGGTWGDIPDEPGAQYVDASYAGGASDGSKAKPWTKIQDAVTAASDGALVAVAAGRYAEDVDVNRKTLRLRGVCPAEVEIIGTGKQLATVYLRRAGKTEIRSVSIRGGFSGITASNAELVVDKVWVHDTPDRGINTQDDLGVTTALVSGSLIESTGGIGVAALGTDVTITGSVVRDTVPGADANGVSDGWGLGAQGSPTTQRRGKLTVTGSVVETSSAVGVNVTGSDAVVEGSVIRETRPRLGTRAFGVGVAANANPDTKQRAKIEVRGSVVERNRHVGVFVGDSDAVIESSVVRDTQPQVSDGKGGVGIAVEDSGGRSSATIRTSDVERSFTAGISVIGSDAVIEATVVRDTNPEQKTDEYGRGLTLQWGANVMIHGVVVERCMEIGIAIIDAEARIESALVRDTRVQSWDGSYGDGVAVLAEAAPANLSLTRSLIEGNARAGLASFGAGVTLGVSSLECNRIPLNGEMLASKESAFSDGGGNRCGCNGQTVACRAISAQLTAPKAIGR